VQTSLSKLPLLAGIKAAVASLPEREPKNNWM